MSEPRRVVVTGMGALTPVGNSVDEYWKNLLAGTSGAGPLTIFDASAFDTRFACELKGFKAADYLDRKSAQRLDPFAQYAVITADMAVADARLSAKELDPDRVGVVIGSGIGGMTDVRNEIEREPVTDVHCIVVGEAEHSSQSYL